MEERCHRSQLRALEVQRIMENTANCSGRIQPCDTFLSGNNWPEVQIRCPRSDDIRGIVEVVRSSEPFLTAHMSYIYWMNIQYFRDTCAVAELDGEIVG